MKKVILRTSNVSAVYLVPDPVAENLEQYCVEFCDSWRWKSPDAAKYRGRDGLRYDESDFIDYLNQYVFTDENSRFIQDISEINFRKKLPKEYEDLPCFLF